MRHDSPNLGRLLSNRAVRLIILFTILALLYYWWRQPPVTRRPPPPPISPSLEQIATFQTEHGPFKWRFFPYHAPQTVSNMQKLISEGHYNNSHLYRAQSNFCLQGGLWNLRSSPFPAIPLEYNLPNKMGFVSMARSGDPNSATTEFSIMLRDNSEWLSPKGSDKHGYAVFAQVIEGWDVIQHIMTLPTKPSTSIQMLVTPVKIHYAFLSSEVVPQAFIRSSPSSTS